VGFDEVQTALVVMSRMLASEYVPVAVNCRVRPLVSDGLPGVTTMDCKAMTFRLKFCTAFKPSPLFAVKVTF
jgi:hypothetical protein